MGGGDFSRRGPPQEPSALQALARPRTVLSRIGGGFDCRGQVSLDPLFFGLWREATCAKTPTGLWREVGISAKKSAWKFAVVAQRAYAVGVAFCIVAVHEREHNVLRAGFAAGGAFPLMIGSVIDARFVLASMFMMTALACSHVHCTIDAKKVVQLSLFVSLSIAWWNQGRTAPGSGSM